MSRKEKYRRFLIILLTVASVFACVFSPWMVLKIKEKSDNLEIDVNAEAFDNIKLIACGVPVGIYLETKGVMVIGSGVVTGEDGISAEPSLGKVNAGDYIVSFNDIDVCSKSQLIFLINKYGKEDVIIGIRRNNEVMDIKIKPVKTGENDYKIGIWVRDDMQGIGTVTYITQDGKFGALGHGISDIDTGELLSSNTGALYEAVIWGIQKGKSGSPGALCGSINYEDENILGTISTNNEQGIYGTVNDRFAGQISSEQKLQAAHKQEVKKGKAYVRCFFEGELKDYEIKITDIDLSEKNVNKGLTIEVIDNDLLDVTNGIVQGMSGSPILQNGKIIGAVTHVFVKNSAKGYGIFIEEMLKNSM